MAHINLGTPVVPLFPVSFGVSILKLNSWKKGYPYHYGVTGEPSNSREDPWAPRRLDLTQQQRAVIPAR